MLQNLDEAVRFLNVLTKSKQQLNRFLNFATEEELRRFSIVVIIYFGLQSMRFYVKKSIKTIINFTSFDIIKSTDLVLH